MRLAGVEFFFHSKLTEIVSSTKKKGRKKWTGEHQIGRRSRSLSDGALDPIRSQKMNKLIRKYPSNAQSRANNSFPLLLAKKKNSCSLRT